MKLKTKFLIYLISIHTVAAAVCFYFLWEERISFLIVEVILFCSFLIGFPFIKKIFSPIDSMLTGIDFIQSRDFTTRFIEVKQQELNRLIQLYNKMVDHLREERIELEEKNLFLNKLIQSSPAAIIIFDPDDNIISVNPSFEKLLGVSGEVLKNKKLSETDHPLLSELNSLTESKTAVFTIQNQRKIRCQKASFINKGFAQCFILIEELTDEFRQTEKKAYEKLIRMMSHEVNNTVGAVNSLLNSSLILKQQLPISFHADFQTALETAIQRNIHLNAFMKSFADVIRIPQPVLRTYNLVDLLNNVENLFHKKLKEANIKFEKKLHSAAISVSIDFNQIEQVIINILKNSIEAIGENGFIIIKTANDNGTIHLSIQDSGIGIPENIQKNLFVPFFTTKENGQGIGLTIIHEILSNHKLEFQLVSKEGGPTQFSIWF